MLACEACGHTWSPASGGSCPACLARGRGRDADGKLSPDPKYFDPTARKQGSTLSRGRPRRREPKPEKRKFCRRCDEEITVGDHRIFCEPCRLEQKRDTSLARYYRLKGESRCPWCAGPVSRSVLCDDCNARQRAKPTTDRELRIMKLSRRRLHATRKSRGRCIYCEAVNTTPYLGCRECMTDRSRYCAARRTSWQAARLCGRCGLARDKPNVATCTRCRAYKGIYIARKREGGRCACGGIVTEGRKMCPRCRAYARGAAAKHRAKRAAQSDAARRSRTQKRLAESSESSESAESVSDSEAGHALV